MPAATPSYGYPYPLGSDKVIEGDDAIELLAKEVEASHANDVLFTPAPYAGSSTLAMLDFADLPLNVSAATGSTRWSYEGTGELVYLGPPRWFLITASTVIVHPSYADRLTASTFELLVGAVRRAVSEVTRSATLEAKDSHHLSAACLLDYGATIQPRARGHAQTADASTIYTDSAAVLTVLSAVPVSPVLA